MNTFEVGTTYKTRDGRIAVIYNDQGQGKYPLIGAIQSSFSGLWEAVTWTTEGQFNYDEAETNFDLVMATPWDDYVIDQKVRVRDRYDQEPSCAHFAGVRDGKPTTWGHGQTSWTTSTWQEWGICESAEVLP